MLDQLNEIEKTALESLASVHDQAALEAWRVANVGRSSPLMQVFALAEELAKMGIRTEQGEDWLSVEAGKAHAAEIETRNDHRLAMSFAIAGLVVPGIKIKGERCVDKSFPGFWEVLQKLYEKDCQPVALTPTD